MIGGRREGSSIYNLLLSPNLIVLSGCVPSVWRVVVAGKVYNCYVLSVMTPSVRRMTRMLDWDWDIIQLSPLHSPITTHYCKRLGLQGTHGEIGLEMKPRNRNKVLICILKWFSCHLERKFCNNWQYLYVLKFNIYYKRNSFLQKHMSGTSWILYIWDDDIKSQWFF